MALLSPLPAALRVGLALQASLPSSLRLSGDSSRPTMGRVRP
jgi:hypothetical protein